MEPTLKRSLSLSLMVLYGVGTTVGAGIYALTGAVAQRAGMAVPLSFALASLLAAFTAFSFAELSARFPRAAGEAVYVREGFGWVRAALGVGLLVALSGTVSAATMSNGFAGYLAELLPLSRGLAICLFVGVLGVIATWGVTESVAVAGVITVIEVGGLLWVVAVGAGALAELPVRSGELLASVSPGAWPGILAGSILAFYAYLGFEDMVNVVEEVKEAPRTLPTAIVVVLVTTTLLYVVVGLISVLVVPPAELAASGAPLVLVCERASGGRADLLGAVGVLAMTNGALIQIVMASRILYGLTSQGFLPVWIGRVNGRTRTPVRATWLVTALILTLALGFPLAPLAEATSTITLLVFSAVNLALWRIQGARPRPDGTWGVPRWVPLAGFAVCVAFLAIEAMHRLAPGAS